MDDLYVQVQRAAPTSPGVPEVGSAYDDAQWDSVSDPEHPYYFLMVMIEAAIGSAIYAAYDPNNSNDAVELLRAACGSLIGTCRGLREYQAEGYSPVEVHDPRTGAYAKLTDEGWAILYAPAAVCLFMDAALTSGSATVEFYEDWFDSMTQVGYTRIGVGRLGSGAPAIPLFWTSLAGYAREVN